MKTKLVNEKLNFERGLDPKVSMNVGGVNFQERFDQMYEEWMTTLKSLEGKTITGSITKHWSKNGISKKDFRIRSVKVKEMDNRAFIHSTGGDHAITWQIYFDGVDEFRYSFFLDQQIRVQDN